MTTSSTASRRYSLQLQWFRRPSSHFLRMWRSAGCEEALNKWSAISSRFAVLFPRDSVVQGLPFQEWQTILTVRLDHSCTKAAAQSFNMMMSNNPRAKRIVVYSWWGFNTALSIAFAALAGTNAGNLRHMGWDSTDQTAIDIGNTQKKAVIAALVLGVAMVLAYSLVSFLLLLSNIISSTLVSGFWYGVLMSSSLHVSLFMLLSALVLQIFKYSIDISKLASQYKDVYKVSLYLCYILVVTYLIQLFMYWLWQRAFTDESSSSAAIPGSINPTGVPVRGQNTGVRKPPSKATKRDQKAIEFNRALQGGNYNTMVV